MSITHKKLTPTIHLLTFRTQQQLASTFLRFQEHYESPFFRGKIFTLAAFKEWYTLDSPNGKRTGRFTYYSDWAGFNIPSYILRPFYEGKFDPLSRREAAFLELFRNEQEPYYIIGIEKSSGNSPAILRHELAHAFFYTSEEYRKRVLEILGDYDLEALKNELRSGYHEESFPDEIHAYCADDHPVFKAPIPEGMRKRLRDLFGEYYREMEAMN